MVFLPDTALLVPGAAGRDDPAAAARERAVAALRETVVGVRGQAPGRVLVVAPGRSERLLPHPVGLGLGAAGLPDPPGRTDTTSSVPVTWAGVAASAALVLIALAGVEAPVDVLEVPRGGLDAAALRALGRGREASVVVAVGSLSARHGPDAPLAEDPRASQIDARLLAALGAGPDALADVLDRLGPDAAAELAVSGWGPWLVALGVLDRHPGTRAPWESAPVRVARFTPEGIAGARHVIAVWLPLAAPPTADQTEESR